MKPILIIRFPSENTTEQFYEGMKAFEKGEDLKAEYHLIFTKDAWTGGRLEFECVNSNVTDIGLEKLQKRIFELIEDKNK